MMDLLQHLAHATKNDVETYKRAIAILEPAVRETLASRGWAEETIEQFCDECRGVTTAPAWHDAPTCEGLWLSQVSQGLVTVRNWHQLDKPGVEAFASRVGAARWYGPIPEPPLTGIA